MTWKNVGEIILWAVIGAGIPSLIEGLSDDHLTYLEFRHTAALAATGGLVTALALLRQMPRATWTDAEREAKKDA